MPQEEDILYVMGKRAFCISCKKEYLGMQWEKGHFVYDERRYILYVISEMTFCMP